MTPTEQIDQINQMLDYFAVEYHLPTRDTDIVTRVSMVLNQHYSKRFKNGIIFLGENITAWICDCPDEETAKRIIMISRTAN